MVEEASRFLPFELEALIGGCEGRLVTTLSSWSTGELAQRLTAES